MQGTFESLSFQLSYNNKTLNLSSIFGEIAAIRVKPSESRGVHPQRWHHPSRHQAGKCDVRQVKIE